MAPVPNSEAANGERPRETGIDIQGFLGGVERVAAVLLLIAFAAVLALLSWKEALSLTIGGAVVMLNFRVLVVIGRRLERATPAGMMQLAAFFFAKFILLLLAVFLILRYMQLTALGFVIGISIIPLALLIQSQRSATRTTRSPEA